MTKEQVKVLQELLETKGVKGKKYLEYALWLNTNQPKFQVGDYVLVTDRNMRIYGTQVIDFKGQVTNIMHFNFMKEHRYEVTVEVGNEKFTVFAPENLVRKSTIKGIHNVVARKSKYKESLDV